MPPPQSHGPPRLHQGPCIYGPPAINTSTYRIGPTAYGAMEICGSGTAVANAEHALAIRRSRRLCSTTPTRTRRLVARLDVHLSKRRKGRRPDFGGRCWAVLYVWCRPLPNDRPHTSVANLIGRFEQQVEYTPTTLPALRRLSAGSNTTNNTAWIETAQRHEWLPAGAESPPSSVRGPPGPLAQA